jgi:ferredoxin-NADP reductase
VGDGWGERTGRIVAGYGRVLRDVGRVKTTLLERFVRPKLGEPYAPPWQDVRNTVDRFHPDRVVVRVLERRMETSDVITLRLEPDGGPFPPFLAGQYVNVYVVIGDVHTSRPYSISSAPGSSPGIEITLRVRPDGFVSPFLADPALVGKTLEVSGPAGEFHYVPLRDTNDLVMLAAGSGVTPFAAMAEDALASDLPIRMTLLYGARYERDIIFRQRLERLARSDHRFRLALTLTRATEAWTGERGRISGEMVRRHLAHEGVEGKTWLLCGPGMLYREMLQALGALGVPRHRIRYEPYGPPDDPTGETGWPVDVDRERKFTLRVEPAGRSIEVSASEPLLNALDRAGVEVPALCRTDVCDTCRTRLVSGSVYTPPDVEDRRPEHNDGFVRPCMAYPVSDVVLER